MLATHMLPRQSGPSMRYRTCALLCPALSLLASPAGRALCQRARRHCRGLIVVAMGKRSTVKVSGGWSSPTIGCTVCSLLPYSSQSPFAASRRWLVSCGQSGAISRPLESDAPLGGMGRRVGCKVSAFGLCFELHRWRISGADVTGRRWFMHARRGCRTPV